MKNYLMKLHKLNRNIRDPVEFANFENAVKFFLKETFSHDIYVPIILKLLKKRKCRAKIKMAYEIASEMKIDISFISLSDLKKDFKKIEIRSSIMKYLLKYQIDGFDFKIKEELKNGRIIMNNSVFNFFKARKHLTKDFMFDENKENIFTQLNLIIHCQIYYNISYFIKFLGSDSKLLSHKAFEAFSSAFNAYESLYNFKDKNRERDFDEGFKFLFSAIYLDFATNNYLNRKSRNDSYKKDFYLNIDLNSLEIESLQNFIKYGYSFLKEKNQIRNVLKTKERSYINANLYNLTDKYFKKVLNSEVDSVSLENLFEKTQILHFDECLFQDNGSFSHLFTKKIRKDICDCIEF